MNRTKLIIDYAAYVAVRTVVCIIQAAPLSTCQAWSRRLGWLFWHVFKLRRATVEENLQTAFPDKSPAEHAAARRSSVHTSLSISRYKPCSHLNSFERRSDLWSGAMNPIFPEESDPHGRCSTST